MKLRYLSIFFALFFLTGCKGKYFFSVQDSIKAPQLSKDQQNLVSSVEEYFGEKFDFAYFPVNERYCSVTEHEFGVDIFYKVVVCQAKSDSENVHILFLKEEDSKKWEIIGEITSKIDELEKVYFKDINKDKIDEILVCKNSGEETYIINSSGVIKL